MDKNALWKWLVLIALTASSLALIYPPGEKINLGIDLRGGVSFVAQVVLDDLSPEAAKDAPERALEVIRNRVDAMGTKEAVIYPEPAQNRIIVQIPTITADERIAIKNMLETEAKLEFRMVHEDNDALVQDLFDRNIAPEGYKIVNREEINQRGGTRSVTYFKRKSDVELSRMEERALREKLAVFQYKPGYEFMLEPVKRDGQVFYRPAFVGKRSKLSGDDLEMAAVDFDGVTGQPHVRLSFDKQGAKRFARITADHAPGGQLNPNPNESHYLGIVLDSTLFSAPSIRTAIYDGNAVIEGGFSTEEAQELARVLRSGALPAPVQVIADSVVSPTLGKDSIDSGLSALIYGAIAVVGFMLLYYLLAGVVANLALLLDLLLLPLGMFLVSGFLGMIPGIGEGARDIFELPTLTLPGIAGIVLTIGMAVDANVLIFERIREEQRAGKRFKAAITAGYDKAFSTIFDANITTLLTAIILFWQGSGPVRGFAITLSAGIIVSMYVALVVTRMIFNLIGDKTNIQSIKMLSIVKNPKINFLSMRYVALILSLVVLAGSWFMFAQRGKDNFGVDFTGGRAITFTFAEKQDTSSIREVLEQAGINESYIQYQQTLAPDAGGVQKDYLEVKVGFEEGDTATAVLQKAFNFVVAKEDSVGPQIGEELRRKGIGAIIWAMVGILLYISWRFEFAFAIGAIVAVTHDVLITVGIYCLLGHQLSLPIVAALLTIVGYSVNDTIVVFDRIREDLKLNKDGNYTEIANLSINQTLSRTLLTSVTTLLTVVMLLVFGGGAINDFAFALFIGIIVGTYSSVFVATPVMLLWHRDKKPAQG